VRSFFTVIKGTPPARRAVRPRPGSGHGRKVHRRKRWTGEGSRRRRPGAAGLAVGGRRPRPAALALGTHGAGRRRSAVPPHPPARRSPPSRTPVTAPARAAGPSSRAGRSCRRESSLSRALRPTASASLATQGQTLDSEPPRQDPAPAGRTEKVQNPALLGVLSAAAVLLRSRGTYGEAKNSSKAA
jgi:hypothetical protein